LAALSPQQFRRIGVAMQTGLDAHEGEKPSNKTFRVTPQS